MQQSPVCEVLTRREQLALKAQEKEENQTNQGRARGGGRGRGGRGRGRKSKKVEDQAHEPEHVPEIPDDNAMDVDGARSSSSKRAVMCTPERRKLFLDTEDEISPTKNLEKDPKVDKPSPAVKPKKAKRAKRGPKTPKSKSTETSQPEPVNTQPEVESEKAEKVPNVKPPTERQIRWAEGVLVEAKSDPPSWHHASKLFEATQVGEREPLEKFHHWGFSMYHQSKRVGLLQSKGTGKKVHVLSFSGGPSCTHIGIPLAAAYMMVGVLFAS